jgi:hypothetical protein
VVHGGPDRGVKIYDGKRGAIEGLDVAGEGRERVT